MFHYESGDLYAEHADQHMLELPEVKEFKNKVIIYDVKSLGSRRILE